MNRILLLVGKKHFLLSILALGRYVVDLAETIALV
jgi:hypothetical protein